MSTLRELADNNRVTDREQITRIMKAVQKGQDAALNAMKERERRSKENDLRGFHF